MDRSCAHVGRLPPYERGRRSERASQDSRSEHWRDKMQIHARPLSVQHAPSSRYNARYQRSTAFSQGTALTLPHSPPLTPIDSCKIRGSLLCHPHPRRWSRQRDHCLGRGNIRASQRSRRIRAIQHFRRHLSRRRPLQTVHGLAQTEQGRSQGNPLHSSREIGSHLLERRHETTTRYLCFSRPL